MIEYEFDINCAEPHLVLMLPSAMEGTEGTQTLIALGSVFDMSMDLAHGKSLNYGDAWRQQGWMGNLARMMSKIARIRFMAWRNDAMDNSTESVTDSALDLVNITGFFVINRSEENKWGPR